MSNRAQRRKGRQKARSEQRVQGSPPINGAGPSQPTQAAPAPSATPQSVSFSERGVFWGTAGLAVAAYSLAWGLAGTSNAQLVPWLFVATFPFAAMALWYAICAKKPRHLGWLLSVLSLAVVLYASNERATRPPNVLRIHFQPDPVFTQGVKDVIVSTMEEANRYLEQVGFETKREIFPITVQEGTGVNVQTMLGVKNPFTAGSVVLGRKVVASPDQIAEAFMLYQFGWIVGNSSKGPGDDFDSLYLCNRLFANYFVSDYRNKELAMEMSATRRWQDILWKMRGKFGRDRVNIILLQSSKIPVEPDATETIDRFFLRKFSIGFATIGYQRDIVDFLKSEGLSL